MLTIPQSHTHTPLFEEYIVEYDAQFGLRGSDYGFFDN
jgi:hypothetical protein